MMLSKSSGSTVYANRRRDDLCPSRVSGGNNSSEWSDQFTNNQSEPISRQMVPELSQNARAISRPSVLQPVPGGGGSIPGTKAGFNPFTSEDVHQVAISLGVENNNGRQGHHAPPLVNAKHRPDGFPGNHPDRPFCHHDLPQPSPTTMDGSPSTGFDPLPILSVILPPLSLYASPLPDSSQCGTRLALVPDGD